jgi:histidine triad (HIT) family protein
MSADCVFCRIVSGDESANVVAWWPRAIAIVPLKPVVDGHLLVLPRDHVADFTERPNVSAVVMEHAATLAFLNGGPCNLITSKGREATQSVFHLHLHIVPRAENDGLALPWYSGRSKRTGVTS